VTDNKNILQSLQVVVERSDGENTLDNVFKILFKILP